MVEEKEEFEKWFEFAERDLRTAKNSLKSGDYYASVFWCQQAIEKGLKGVAVKDGKKILRVHDLVKLAKETGLLEKYFSDLEILTTSYIEARYYVDIGSGKKFEKEDAEKFIKLAEDVLEWIKKKV